MLALAELLRCRLAAVIAGVTGMETGALNDGAPPGAPVS
jgi:hypothetical protein